MLHITNGDYAGETLQAVVRGTVLPWRDALHDGPVPAVPDDALRRIRARFLASAPGYAGGLSEADILGSFEQRDATIAGAAREDEVVLWFEHDLYDQLQLIQVLDRLAKERPARLSLICLSTHPEVPDFSGLGQLSAAQLAALFPTRQPVTEGQIALARGAWRAFCAPEPSGLAALATETALPSLPAAIRRHLEEYPGLHDGLSRTERQILRLVAEGVVTPAALFRANQRLEEAVWQGDVSFFAVVARLTRGEDPPLRWNGQLAGAVQITPSGLRLLAGEDDHVRLNGIDRWLGGVHLVGTTVRWRWNGERIVRAGSTGGSE
ncbi:MAG: hypothetical protein KatS3mg060_0289 [Dehalococcoidia bacterium]|nr:MAG: hypothetical protein KatS3mg060_0289 [Dehalococcoidia bacterium]